MVTEDMIAQCELSPVPSRSHDWRGKYQRQAYDILNANGRTLYDNLRTQFGVAHSEAFQTALERHGLCKTLFLD